MKAFENLIVSSSSGVTSLNAEIYEKNQGLEVCDKATINIEGGSIRYRVDGGDPTSTVGLLANGGDVLSLSYHNELKFFRAILDASASADAVLNIDYGVNHHE
jgi:hypothetical protein